MKLLIDSEATILSCGEHYERREDGTMLISGGRDAIFYPNLLEANSSIVEVDAGNIPANVVQRYKYINGEFVRNPQYKENTEESMFVVFQSLDPNIPKTGDVNRRIEKLINFILEIAKRPETLFDVPEDLVEGLKLRNANINSLTGTDLRNYKIGQNYINKIKTRFLIESQIGDVCDQVANSEKQTDLTYTMNIRTFLLVKNLYDHLSLPIPESILPQEEGNNVLADYVSFGNLFLSMIASGQYFDRIDVDNAEEVINSILPRKPNLATIVKENYLDKYYIID